MQQVGFEVKAADSLETPGTPPSSYWSFLNQVSNLTGIVLTDHYDKYSNDWYHSVYDSYYNSLDVEQICMTATLFGRLIYKLASNETQYNEEFMKKYINADCLLVEQLMQCLMVDMTCDLVSTMASSATDSTPTHYTSVYKLIIFIYNKQYTIYNIQLYIIFSFLNKPSNNIIHNVL